MSSLRVLSTVLASSLLAAAMALPAPSAAATTTTAPTLASRMTEVRTAKSINYYPSNAAWSAMWSGFDAKKIDADLAKAAALGADNVRVIVFPQTFGFPKPTAVYAERLKKFVSLAGAHKMTVKLTLFDWWDGYTDIADSIAWARAVLAPYANDRRVIAVELKNEFQPDDTAAVAWVRKLIPAIRSAVPGMPLTLSVDGQTGAAGMKKIKKSLTGTPLDYYDFHFYGNSELALTEIKRAQAAVAPTPIVIGETGLSTVDSSAGEQAAFLARVFRAARDAGVRSVGPWTLTDFAAGAIPRNSSVSTKPAQYGFGLHRADGTPKAAAAVVRAAWTSGATPNTVLNLGFETSVSNSPWQRNLPKGGGATIVTGTARTGKQSAKFTRTTRTAAGLPSLQTSPITPVRGGHRWRAEAYARGSNATGTTEIALSWFDANGKWIRQDASRRLPNGTTTWTKLVVETTAPANAAGVQLHLKSGDNKGSVWFDDVAIS
ncbi:cellulase family glycosylhydrolase [Actinoplanes sp. NEAU-A12]|uniref:Cellulase family glycosylhydrolase n=1 Tax=Actinoplanes sandaracinus TaxID=3045177 RepID=A0ABT6WSH4_9ACTN|nr:cellulase family glycosylhydrolase [Actinoplanes sandaracinus]MDI6102701.1 cellulase family glycosylhydrolase [Actinoplanes sandaracinus]